jgi:flagellar hook assembly protein FlgD
MGYPAAMGVAGRVAARTLALIAALIAALVFTTVADLTASARGAEPMKAVVIVGPAHSATSQYLTYGEKIARAAEAQGMTVARVFHPMATWARVKEETLGAKLVVYLGHGFGWPSPYPYNLFESQMNGFGLNWPASDPRRGTSDVHYYGGDKIRQAPLRFAENAVVVLNHLCYSAGFGETGQSAPSLSIARERVDNFAAAFLAVGAGVVFALAYQPLADEYGGSSTGIISWLMTKNETMLDVFQRRRNSFGDSAAGWVGWNPTYHDSVRTPGATILLDPHQQQSYRRAITGNLALTTTEWRGAADPSDVTPPELTQFTGLPLDGTIPANEDGAPIITPNGDGLSDAFQIDFSVSEPAFVDFEVKDETGATVRTFTQYSTGTGTGSWNGKTDSGDPAPDGRYEIHGTPRDLSDNVGLPASTPVKVMRTMKSPKAAPKFFFPSDGDALKATSELSVEMTDDATVDWTVVDADDNVVRTFMDDQSVSPGLLAQSWDGRDDAGNYVPNGVYRQVVRATTDVGSYSHETGITVGAFKLTAPRWSGPAGTRVTFTMKAAEPVSGWPDLYVYQPGLSRFRASPVRYSSTKFKFTITFRSGGSPGQVRLNLSTTDTGGGQQSQNFYFTLE